MKPLSVRDLDALDAEERQAWLEERRKGIGASEAAGVLGVSPWATPLSIYADKVLSTSTELDEQTLERFRWGHLLEPTILREFELRSGIQTIRHPQNEIVWHPDAERTHMFATPDGRTTGENWRPVQVKVSSSYMAHEWREGVPLHYAIQEQHEMEVTGTGGAIIAALVGGHELVWYEIERNQRFIDQMIPEIRRFWEEHVCQLRMPAADGSKVSVKALDRLHPDDNGEEIQLDDSLIRVDEKLQEVKESLKETEKEKKRLECEIKAALGDNTYGIIGGVVRYSWKTQARKNGKTSRVLRRGKARR